MSNELVTIENINPALVFVPNGLDPLLERIEKEARSELQDVSTHAGRENIRSLAFKIAKSKNALDKMGKDLGAEYREKVSAINAERGKAVERLDALQKEIRAPLTEFEDKEKNRIAEHEANILIIEQKTLFEFDPTIQQVQERLESLTRLDNKDWEEFKVRAEMLKKLAIESLTKKLADMQKIEAEQAELARLREAEQQRLQKERDEKIASEAAAKAKAEAEAKAIIEAERQAKLAEQARLDVVRQKEAAELALKKAEEDKKTAADKAEREKIEASEAAAKKERERQLAEKLAEEKAASAREADKVHKSKINNEALDAIYAITNDTEKSKLIVTAIAKGEIPNVSIKY